MATRRVRCGIDHPTVVPENFEPEDEEDSDERDEESADETELENSGF